MNLELQVSKNESLKPQASKPFILFDKFCILARLNLFMKEPFILFDKLLHSRQTYSLFSKEPFILFDKYLHSRQT